MTNPLTLFLTSIRQPILIKAYDWTNSSAFPNSLFAFLIKSFLLTGKDLNNSLTTTVVPFDLATFEPTIQFPSDEKDNEVPAGAVEIVEVIIESVAVPHKELKASPLNPSVSTEVKSSYVVSLEVWCFNAVHHKNKG